MKSKLIQALAVVAIFLGVSSGMGWAETVQGNELKEILENFDHQFMSSMRLDLDVNLPTHMEPVHGKSQASVIISSDGSSKHLDLTRTAHDPIKYRKTAHNVSATSSPTGDMLVLNVDKHIAVFSDKNAWRVRRESESVYMGGDDKPVRPVRMVAPRLDLYPQEGQDAANLYYRYILPLGRGYAQLIHQVTEITYLTSDILAVKAKGTLFSPYQGTWNLEIDAKSCFLVRKASFTQEGAARPNFTCAAEKLYSASPLPIFAQGLLTMGSNYEIGVKLKSVSLDPQIVMNTKSLIRNAASSETLPGGATIFDFRSIDSDRMPAIKRVHGRPQ